MRVLYQNLFELTPKECDAMTQRFADGGATTITVVMEKDGEVTVLSPQSRAVTQYNLQVVAANLPSNMAMN